jgi:rRNA maturation protein Rpf1
MQAILPFRHFFEVLHLILPGRCFRERRTKIIRVIGEVSVEEGQEKRVVLLECLVLFE